uniref:Ovule protein n=1 Tax=Caenorhabditis tropicalis TaxID=1561998 RepID=A0A1I7U9X5_9PELO
MSNRENKEEEGIAFRFLFRDSSSRLLLGTLLVLAMNANVFSIVCFLSFLVLCISAQLVSQSKRRKHS